MIRKPGHAAFLNMPDTMGFINVFKKIAQCILSVFVLFCLFLPCPPSEAEELHAEKLTVVFDDTSADTAREVVQVYGIVASELSQTTGWEIDFRPVVLLTRNRNNLRNATGSRLIVALAVPDRNLMVLDISRVFAKPFTLKTTLKHELCHLLLHRNIARENLPRWLDEGVCQWASDGIAEIISDNSDQILTRAASSDRLIRMSMLTRFPADGPSLILSYAQSRSIVEFITGEFGKEGLMRVLSFLRYGDSLDESLRKGIALSPHELEVKWQAQLKRKHTIIPYMSRNLTVILFALTALITVYGFIMMLRKKRAYKDIPEDDMSPGEDHADHEKDP